MYLGLSRGLVLSQSFQRISLCLKKDGKHPGNSSTNLPVQMVLSLPSESIPELLEAGPNSWLCLLRLLHCTKTTWKVAMKIGLCRNHAGVHPGKQVCGDLEESKERARLPSKTS